MAAEPGGPYGGSGGSSTRHHDTSFGLDDDHYSQHSGSSNGSGSDGGGCRGCEKMRSDEESDRVATSVSSAVNVQVPAMAPTRSPSWAPSATTQSTQHPAPEIHHSLKHGSSVLALTVGDGRIYAGTQDGEIVVWSLGTYRQLHSIQAHKRSVLSLFLSDDGSMLFSSAASDPIVNVWCPKSMRRLYEIYSTNDSFGDIFSVAYSAQNDTVYYGAQNTSIQWASLTDLKQQVAHDSANHPDRRNHRFFDSRAVGGGASTPRMTDERYDLIPRSHTVIETDKRANLMYAHYGFIYCMMITKGLTALADADEEILVTGGGDGTIKAWKLGSKDAAPDGLEHGLEEIMLLGEEDANSIMSLQVDGSFLYSGKLSGVIELWDLDTQQKLRQIKAHDGNVWSLQMGWGYLWSASSSGTASKHSTVQYGKFQSTESQNISQKYQCLTKWHAHDGKILASVVTTHENNQLYITGANDNSVSVWALGNEAAIDPESHEESEDMMITSLREFVSYKTISSNHEFAEDCRQGATWLRSLFKKLGAEVEMLHADDVLHHPVVFAKFTGKQRTGHKRKRVLFYGHYDVVPADTKDAKWDSDPFQLRGENGFLYGRGVSDNKGPIMAALYAVTDLMQAKALDSDVLFLIEGQEESGSSGFRRTVRTHRDTIGDVDYVLLANSYWLNDDIPCLTYGLRGVMHATICVESQRPDLHSGVDGSYMINEPMSDLMTILSKLKGPRNTIMLPGFYDNIPALTCEEEARYDAIIDALGVRSNGKTVAENLKKNLMARWREPNLTQHAVNVSGSGGGLISSHASAKISIRLVPGQEVQETVNALTSYLQNEFGNLVSDNVLTVQIDNTAEPWLGDPDNYIFRTLEEAVVKAWSPLFAAKGDANETESSAEGKATEVEAKGPTKPLYIREGGSIPAIRFLEKEFDAPAAHLPCGQASDSAHLNNEKLRVENLFKSREIFADVFRRL